MSSKQTRNKRQKNNNTRRIQHGGNWKKYKEFVEKIQTCLFESFTGMDLSVEMKRKIMHVSCNGNRCFSFKIQQDKNKNQIELASLKHNHDELKCDLSGTELLKRIVNFLRILREKMDNKEKLLAYVVDGATVKIKCNDKDLHVSLGVLSIIKHGMSWYNRYGFYTNKKFLIKVINHNEEKLSQKIQDIFKKLKEYDADISDIVDPDMTVRDCFHYMFNLVQTNPEHCILFKNFMRYLSVFLFIDHDPRFDFKYTGIFPISDPRPGYSHSHSQSDSDSEMTFISDS